MRNLKNAFSYSIAEEIMPDLSHFKNKSEFTKFAIILKTGESISIPEICGIKTRTGLYPLIFDIFENANSDFLRSYARSLSAPIVKVSTQSKFAFTVRECSFSISEDVTGAFLSLLSHTPAYVDAGSAEIRRLIGQILKFDISQGLLIPYTKNRTEIITHPIAKSADFYGSIKKIRADIDADFKNLFF